MLDNKTGVTRLGFGLILKFFQLEARFPYAKNEIPSAAVTYVAKQLDIYPSLYLQYDWRGRAIKYHRAHLREFLGFGEPTLADEDRLLEWLGERALAQDQCSNTCALPPPHGFIFYGRSGEFSMNSCEEQESGALGLHLVQNCLVYINTLMIQRVLSEPGWANRMKPEDLRALTLLIYSRINPYDTFHLNMQERMPLEGAA